MLSLKSSLTSMVGGGWGIESKGVWFFFAFFLMQLNQNWFALSID